MINTAVIMLDDKFDTSLLVGADLETVANVWRSVFGTELLSPRNTKWMN